MQVHQIFTANCLNPCCNGIYLIIQGNITALEIPDVLILVVMEYT